MGSALKISPELIFVPAIVNTLFSLGAILVLFFLARDLFENELVALASVCLVSFFPWFVWLSLSALSESIFIFFVALSCLFWIRYIKSKRCLFLLFSAIGFLFSTMIRNEGWFFAFVFSLFILKDILVEFKGKKKIKWNLLIYPVVACFFIPVWLIYKKYCYGSAFFGSTTPLALRVCPGVRSIFSNIFFYPAELVKLSPEILILSTLSFIKLRKFTTFLNFSIFLLLELILVILAASFYVIPCVLPFRPILINIFLLVPLASFGLFQVIVRKKVSHLRVFIYLILTMSITALNIHNCYGYNLYTGQQAIKTGVLLKSLSGGGIMTSEDKVILEERTGKEPFTGRHKTWECNSIYIFRPDQIIFDRKKWYTVQFTEKKDSVLETAGNPSIFGLPLPALKNYLKEKNLKVAVIHSESIAQKLNQIMDFVVKIGEYNFYVFPEDKLLFQEIKAKAQEILENW